MKSVCAWCKTDLGEIGEYRETFGITHGICEKCLKVLLSKDCKPMHEFLDSLSVPVVMMDSEVGIRTGNKHARELFGKELPEIDDHSTGDVIECVYSKTPEGCGNDIHCKSCVIRRTVQETFDTGKSFTNIPAYPDIETFSNVKSICFRISTEKVGDFVLLRIDDVKGN
jgi:hypothetical protein